MRAALCFAAANNLSEGDVPWRTQGVHNIAARASLFCMILCWAHLVYKVWGNLLDPEKGMHYGTVLFWRCGCCGSVVGGQLE